ncbi:MAG: DUF11 domain-containing protein [Polyangiaceae bacterium]|nr:DUF11 domain-containing protein [Polyangiaceae bacterium]
MKRNVSLRVGAALCLAAGSFAHAHSVAQVQTAKRISQQTVVLLDPQGNPTPGGVGTDTTAKVGDVLTFILQFTALPNNATRGAGGYITEYVPANTEVVGARLIDRDGNTVFPKAPALMDDGWGPRGRHNGFDAMGLQQGSLAQVYADTGIFFSTDPRTARNPANAFITVQNGIAVTPVPTGAGQLDNFLGFAGPPFYSHNVWDQVQAIAYGANGGSVVANGTGNTPFLYGSAVAGPDTHYLFEKVAAPRCSDGADNDGDSLSDYPNDPGCASALDDDETAAASGPVGPWQRIRSAGSTIGTGGATNCQSCAGAPIRAGLPIDTGWDLSLDNPLPAGTNAVRYAVGELIVGQEYFAEISLRVLALPLDPTMNADVNCAEVFGGDAAMPQQGQDNTWRYFVPSPSCVQLNLFFELAVDKLLAVTGDTLTYTITGKNLSVNPQSNVVVTDTFVPGDVQWVGVLQGPAPTVGNGLLTWPTMTLQPGDAYTFQWQMNVTGNGLSTLNRATYTSAELPAPGFSVVALTDIEAIIVIDHAATVATTPATDPPSTTTGSTVHYTATVTDVGTGAATLNAASYVEVTLPTGISYCPPPGCAAPRINGVNVANPTVAGNTVTFTQGLATVPANGGTLVLDFDASVAAAPGLYTIDLQTQFRDNGVGRDVENATFGLAPLLVDAVRSEPPVVTAPVLAGATQVQGTTSEGQGATITLYVNGNSVAPVIAGAGGAWTAAVPTLYAGQHLNATAEAAGEIVSLRSSPDVVVQGVSAVTQCNDGADNDADGLTDFPDDPGCTDALDPDETDVPACSDGLDNDSDGLTDYPDDPSCASLLDTDESGPPACSDGGDNDADGLTDFPDDPGCTAADDVSEADYPACANGLDDDGDTFVDYPNDPGCADPYDDDEASAGTGGAGGGGSGGSSAGGGGAGATSAGGSGNGLPPDLGGVEPGDVPGADGGCSCELAGRSVDVPFGLVLAGLLPWLLRTRRARGRAARR